MSWIVPQKHKKDYRKDVPEGVEGIIEGWADLENRQVLLKVVMDLPEGKKQTVVHSAYPRNLHLTSEYLLQKAGFVDQEEEKEPCDRGSGSSGSKRKASEEWLLLDSDPAAVQVEPKWSKLLSDQDKLNKTFWLKSKIGICLESLKETLPVYSEKDLVVCHRQNEKGAWKSEV